MSCTQENITFILDESSKNFVVNVENNNINIPKNGLFVSILNIGIADDNGKLIPTTPYTEVKNNKK